VTADSLDFGALVAPHLSGLQAHCYRMLGSLADAEDLVQETLLRSWGALPKFEGRSSFRTWLYRIATHACLDRLDHRKARLMPTDAHPPVEPPIRFDEAVRGEYLEPCPARYWEVAPGPEAVIGARESVALAFLVALQRLPPLQRAVLLLRDVVGMSADETTALLDTSVAAVNSALQRARAALADRPARPERATVEHDPSTGALLARYVQAWEARDARALVALLREDAMITMPPSPLWLRGRRSIEAFLPQVFEHMGELRVRRVAVNGGPGLASWARCPGDDTFRAYALQAVVVDGLHVVAIHAYLDPALFPRFTLPLTV
jgi:RNA polymerase sigma-70 factor (ECF subfamily)